MATYANLHPKYVFGLSSDVQGQACWFVENNTIIYPAGNSVVTLNTDFKTQQFLHGVEKGNGVTAITVSPNKVYAAVAQKGERPSIGIYELKQNKKRKTLINLEGSPADYISLAFTQDLVHLASLTAGPEYQLVLWKWDKGRVVSMAKTTGGLGPVYEITTSPGENNVMCAIGQGAFRFFRYNEGHLKPFGFQKGDTYHFLCHTWLAKGDRLIAGTANGKIMCFERGEYRHDIPVRHVKSDISGVLAEMHLKSVATAGTDLHSSDGKPSEGMRPTLAHAPSIFRGEEVTAMASFSKGFAAAVGTGNVVVFEEQLVFETPEEHYKQLYVIKIPTDTSEAQDRIVTSLTVNPSEEVLVAVTYNRQIFSFTLSSAELQDADELKFEYVNCSFHFGPIVAMDVAVRKSLLVTAGVDRFIRVWNYVTMTQENSKEFAEDIYCVSFHPTGLFILAGCVDKIRIFTVLMDDIRELKDFAIRSCRECIYSHGGQLFAAANGNIIHVYSSVTFDNICNMKGHSNKIRKLCWSQNDAYLYSCGADGAVYEWEIMSAKRTADVVDRGSNILAVVASADSKLHYMITGNGFIKELQLYEGMIVKELELHAMAVSLALSPSGKILVASCEDGLVRSFKQPLTYAGEWFDYHMHTGRVTKVCITYDEVYCISCSEDGTIFFWKLTDAEGRVTKIEKDISYASEVLITKSDLEERQVVINDLRQKMGELRLEMDYQLKRKDMLYQEELTEVNSKFQKEVATLGARIDELVQIKDKSDLCHHNFLKEVGKKQELTLENLESHFNTKLIAEFEKYNRLQNLLEDTIKDYEARIASLESQKTSAMEELVDYYEGKLKGKNSALECAFDEARTSMEECEEMKRQIEEDADQEILELTTSYERKLKFERDLNHKLKAEAGIMRKKFSTMQKEIEEHKNEVQRLLTEGSKMKVVIQSTEKEISSLRKDLVDRDQNVHDKEKIIFDLKKTNNELEKFKFVLDYKIKELKKMIEPKDREIIYLKQLNQDMETELEGTIALKNGLQLQVNELTNKLRITDGEYQKERRQRWKLNILLGRIRSQLSQAMKLLEDPKALKSIIKITYAKYGHSIEVSKATNQEQEAICELVRQKNHLEVSLHSIKRKMAKDVHFARSEQRKIMHENMLLVYEINELRRELKIARDKVSAFELAFGIRPNAKPGDATEMRMKLQNAVMKREDIDMNHEVELEEKEELIQAQQAEIDGLAKKFLRVNEYVLGVKQGGAGNAVADQVRIMMDTV